jgi:peptide/nickel transport system permease protein
MTETKLIVEDNSLDQTKAATQALMIWENFKRHRIAVLASVVFILMALACFAAPLIAPYEFDAINLKAIRQPPSAGNLLGTDDLGRDLLTRILYGGRISITIGLLSALVGTGLGALIGAIAGYYGGTVDNLLMRFTDVAYSIPTLPLLIVLSSFSNSAVPVMVLIIGFLSWMPTARVVRGSVLSAKEKEYVEAARMIGAPDRVIIWQHILPTLQGPLLWELRLEWVTRSLSNPH